MASNSNSGADKLTAFIQAQHAEAATKLTAAQVQKAAIIALLGELGGMAVTDDSIEFTGTKIILPEQYEGKILDAVKFLERYHASQEKTYGFNKTFNYRPWDGAYAFNAVMKQMFGNTGIGKNIPATMFSPERPPQMMTINIGLNKTEQVPWGEVEFPPLEATFQLNSVNDREKGRLFHLGVEAPKKYRKHIDAFYQLVEKYLRENSIYKGKAINGAENPEFLDTSRVDPKKVVYSEKVMDLLDQNLFGRVRNSDEMREMGIPLKRAVLLEGPYGTGKSLAGYLTAQEAERSGWTYILCRPGQDDLFDTLKTAQLYAPSVVWFEDIDVIASDGDPEKISKLLDLLDGVQGKGVEVIAGFTTNFVDKLQKGVLRPGRIDAIIHIGELDAAGLRKLIGQLIKPEFLGTIDYERVQAAFKGFLPAFVAEAINGALAVALIRNGGRKNGVKINTDDLQDSAFGLHRQLELMNGANEGSKAPTIDSVLKDTLKVTLDKTRFVADKDHNTGLYVDEDREIDLNNV